MADVREMSARVYGPAPERFWVKVDRESGAPCWLWTAYTTKKGYGSFRDDGVIPAHRWAYEEMVGPIPAEMTIDHLCRVRACVNPLHLEVVTSAENTRRGLANALNNGMHDKCINGHLRTAENTYIGPKYGNKSCRQCMRDVRARRNRSEGA